MAVENGLKRMISNGASALERPSMCSTNVSFFQPTQSFHVRITVLTLRMPCCKDKALAGLESSSSFDECQMAIHR